jgi:hypothetical protein
MILNLDNLDASLKNTWAVLANELDKLGYNLNVDSGRRGATVFHKESGVNVGGVTREMIEEEEIDYILYSRLNLERSPNIDSVRLK